MLVYDPKKIRELRDARRWSLKKAGREAGISDNTWWRYEQGRVGVKAGHSILKGMAGALGVPLSTILSAQQKPSDVEELLAVIDAMDERARASFLLVGRSILEAHQKRR